MTATATAPAPTAGTVDIAGDAFAKRLANLLADRRDHTGSSVRALARASKGRFTAKELKAIEAATLPLSEPVAFGVGDLYGVDLTEILQERLPLVIRPIGVLSTGGVVASFEPQDPTSLLVSYLRLVRRLRNAEQAPTITLRRDDVESIAEYLHEPGERIVERLGSLMGATQVQRKAMVGMFVAGAVVIGLVGTAAAATIHDGPQGASSLDRTAVTTVATIRDGADRGTTTADSSVITVVTETGRVTVTRPGTGMASPDTTGGSTTTDASGAAAAVDRPAEPGVAEPTTAPVTAAAPAAPHRPSAPSRAVTPAPTVADAAAADQAAADQAAADQAAAETASAEATADQAAADRAAAQAADAAARDAAVVAAAQADADADAARIAAEQAAAKAKAARIAAEQAAAATTTTTTAP